MRVGNLTLAGYGVSSAAVTMSRSVPMQGCRARSEGTPVSMESGTEQVGRRSLDSEGCYCAQRPAGPGSSEVANPAEARGLQRHRPITARRKKVADAGQWAYAGCMWSALYGAVDALAPAPVVRFGSENERSQHRGFKPQLSLRAKPQPVPANLSATFRVASIAVPPSAAILRSRAST